MATYMGWVFSRITSITTNESRFQMNILVDYDETTKEEFARITDLGLSVIANGAPREYDSEHGGGILLYRAPELHKGIQYEEGDKRRDSGKFRPTVSSDMFAFACTCVEVTAVPLLAAISLADGALFPAIPRRVALP